MSRKVTGTMQARDASLVATRTTAYEILGYAVSVDAPLAARADTTHPLRRAEGTIMPDLDRAGSSNIVRRARATMSTDGLPRLQAPLCVDARDSLGNGAEIRSIIDPIRTKSILPEPVDPQTCGNFSQEVDGILDLGASFHDLQCTKPGFLKEILGHLLRSRTTAQLCYNITR